MCTVQVVGRSLVHDFITPDFQESVQEVLQNALLGKETDNFEFPLYTKNGTRVFEEVGVSEAPNVTLNEAAATVFVQDRGLVPGHGERLRSQLLLN